MSIGHKNKSFAFKKIENYKEELNHHLDTVYIDENFFLLPGHAAIENEPKSGKGPSSYPFEYHFNGWTSVFTESSDWREWDKIQQSWKSKEKYTSDEDILPNVFLSTEPSGLVIIDFDQNGIQEEFLNNFPELYKTCIVRRSNVDKKNGKCHIYFRIKDKTKPPPSKLNLWFGDIISTGKGVMCPPSVHYSGGVYEFYVGNDLLDIDIDNVGAKLFSNMELWDDKYVTWLLDHPKNNKGKEKEKRNTIYSALMDRTLSKSPTHDIEEIKKALNKWPLETNDERGHRYVYTTKFYIVGAFWKYSFDAPTGKQDESLWKKLYTLFIDWLANSKENLDRDGHKKIWDENIKHLDITKCPSLDSFFERAEELIPKFKRTLTPKQKEDREKRDDEIKQLFEFTPQVVAKEFVERHKQNLTFKKESKNITYRYWDEKLNLWVDHGNTLGVIERDFLYMIDSILKSVRDEEKKQTSTISDGEESEKAILKHIIKCKKESLNKYKISASMLNMALRFICQFPDKCKYDFDSFDDQRLIFNLDKHILKFSDNKIKMALRDEKYLYTKKVPYNLNSSAQCDNWIKYLDSTFDYNKEIIDFVQQMFGYMLLGTNPENKSFLFIGGGSNGKSVMLNVINELFGSYSYSLNYEDIQSASETNSFMWSIHSAVGSKVLVCSEKDDNEGAKPLKSDRIKRLTGGDKMNVRGMFKNFNESSDFQATFTLIIAANKLPEITDRSEGIWRRLLILPFDITFSEENKNIIYGIEKILYSEIEGILLWALRGLKSYFENGFNIPESIKAEANNYKLISSQLNQFVNDMLIVKKGVLNKNEPIKGIELYNEYLSWCKACAIDTFDRSYKRASQFYNAINTLSEFKILKSQNGRTTQIVGVVPKQDRMKILEELEADNSTNRIVRSTDSDLYNEGIVKVQFVEE